MISIKKYIKNLKEKSFVRISAKAEAIILERFSEMYAFDDEGRLHEYSDQDIWEQCRKIIEWNK